MHILHLLLLATALASPAARAQAPETTPADPAANVKDTMAQRMQACVVCHGKEGRATSAGYFPRIAGKPAGYLYNQLQNFKVGRRRNMAMNHLVEHLSDDYMRAIAQYFSELDLPYPPARAPDLNPQQVETAKALVFKGAPERELPACVACHGEQMAGKQPAMPGLLTLPTDYLVGQLGAWRTGQRKAKEPDCMAEVARRLTADELSAVVRWLSAQTLPPNTKPESASAAPLPMPCGSGQP